MTEVTYNRMIEVATKVSESIATYNRSVEKIYQIGDELDRMWDGESSDKFKIKLGQDRESFNAMLKILINYVEALQQMIEVYRKAEMDAVTTVNVKKY